MRRQTPTLFVATLPDRKASGFTLIELIVTIAVAIILASLALPSYRTMILNAARTSSTNEILFAFTAARQESLKQGRAVKVCPSKGVDDGCLKDDNDAWENGLLVFVDLDDDDTVGNNEQVVLYTSALPAQSRTRSSAKEFIFRPFNRRSTNRTIFICDERGVAEARAIITNVSGRPHVASHGESGINWNCPN